MKKVILFVICGGVLIALSLVYFPRWFGLEGVELESPVVTAAPDTLARAPETLPPQPVAPPTPSPTEENAPPAKSVEERIAEAEKLLLGGEHKRARATLEALVAEAPSDPAVRLRYGRALFQTPKKRMQGIAQVKKAIKLQPGFADAYYELGSMYAKTSQPIRARVALASFLKVSPRDERAPVVRRTLAKLSRRAGLY